MDSKLVIEQMAGRWKIKHADMRQLAMEARRLIRPDMSWIHVPRERNKAADSLLNKVLDGGPPVWSTSSRSGPETEGEREAVPPTGPVDTADLGTPTALLLLRHGETAHSVARLFSGSGGDDVPLTPRGHIQAEAAAATLAGRTGIGAVVSSPLRRARETAETVASSLGVPVRVEPGLTETDFGAWEGRTFAEVQERWPQELASWLASTSARPPGGESLDAVGRRVSAAVDPLLTSYAGRGVVLVTHGTPIKALVCQALDVPLRTAFRMDLPTGTLGEVHWYADGRAFAPLVRGLTSVHVWGMGGVGIAPAPDAHRGCGATPRYPRLSAWFDVRSGWPRPTARMSARASPESVRSWRFRTGSRPRLPRPRHERRSPGSSGRVFRSGTAPTCPW